MSWFTNKKWYEGYDYTSKEVFDEVDKCVLGLFSSFDDMRLFIPEEVRMTPIKITVKTAIKIILHNKVYGEWPRYQHLIDNKDKLTRDDLPAKAYEDKLKMEGKV